LFSVSKWGPFGGRVRTADRLRVSESEHCGPIWLTRWVLFGAIRNPLRNCALVESLQWKQIPTLLSRRNGIVRANATFDSNGETPLCRFGESIEENRILKEQLESRSIV
jgi:hypothetical protein